MIRPRHVLFVATLLAALAALPAPGHSAAAATTIGPKAYYLALGDSLAFGFQPDLQFYKGYADDFAQNLRARTASTLINMGCPGETSTTFIRGGCPFPIHKYPYTGPQLTAALTFIHQHPGQVSPVTIDIGADDFLPLINPSTCVAPTQSFSQTLATFDRNFSTILALLHRQLGGTGDLLTMTYYFPYQNQCPNLLPYVETFNRHLVLDALRNGALVAPVFQFFGGAAVPNPHICTYTWICSAFHDVHATSTGYAVIARAFESAAGY